MFNIKGGKEAFDQWSTGQVLKNPHMEAGNRVFFRGAGGAVYTMYADANGVVVPNILLQDARPMTVDLENHPECRTRFVVNATDKPADYELEDNIPEPKPATGVSSWNDLTDRPIMVVDLTYLDDGETGMYTVALSKSFDEIKTAYDNGETLFVKDSVLFQVVKLQGKFLTCYGLTSNSYGEQFRLISFSLKYNQDNQWSMIPTEGMMLYDPQISGLVLYSGGRLWRIEVNSSGQVVATDFYA